MAISRQSRILQAMVLGWRLLAPMLVLGCSTATLLAQEPLLENERLRMPYMPNTYGNLRTTPAYHYATSPHKTMATSITTTQVNVNASQQNIVGDAANEPSIAINPFNPLEIAVGWRQFDNVGSDFRQAGNAFSTDGGATWTVRAPLETGVFRSDPVLDFASDGTFYYNSLTRDSANVYTCNLYTSTDGGASWGGGASMGGGDKQWMAVDRTGGAADGNIYSAWSQYFTSCGGAFTRSEDGGANWDSCARLAQDPFWVNVAVSPNGEVGVVGFVGAGSKTFFMRSQSAAVMGQPVVWDTVVEVHLDGRPNHLTYVNPDGLMGQYSLEADASAGAGHGFLYLLCSVTRSRNPDPADVMFVKSTDRGDTWESLTQVNDDTTHTAWQWFGTMGLAPNGRLDAVWLDTRDTVPPALHSALYYSYSLDQGQTWSANERLSTAFDPYLGWPMQAKLGDYYDMVSMNDAAHLVWAATFNGEQDVYYSRIVPPVLVDVEVSQLPRLQVAPNPTLGHVWVEGCPLNAQLTLTDLLGRRLGTATATAGRVEWDLTAQPAGVYIVHVAGAGSVRVVRR